MTESELIENFKSQYWRLNNLYWILNEKGESVKFQMRPAQSDLYRTLHYFNIVLKARQLGFTTFIDLLALDMVLFTKDFEAEIIAHKQDAAEKIFRGKIIHAYNKLPAAIRSELTPVKQTASEIIFSNNSKIRVTTSARSSTVQFLHISEYGSIGAKYPEKAREIKTGSLPSVHPGGFCFIESTAEGNSGHFYDLCQQSQKDTTSLKRLAPREFKFHFFAWWQNPGYVLDVGYIEITRRLTEYFDDLELKLNIKLSPEQRAWYAMEEKTLGEDMRREHPSTAEEAFRVSTEGCYYKQQFKKIYAENRICNVPYEESALVYTFWDLGIADEMSIWFIQFIGRERRVIDYLEASGEGLSYYASELMKKGYLYGGHYAPHDIEVRELGTGLSRKDQAQKLGIRFETVPCSADVSGGIDSARNLLGGCWFDERKCEQGIKCLENYRKEWDAKAGIFKARPCHDWTSHGADSFRTYSTAHLLGMIKASALQQPRENSFRQKKVKCEHNVL